MKTIVLTFSLLLILTGKVFSQWQYHINHEKCIGGNGNETVDLYLKSIITTADRSIVTAFSLTKDTALHLPFKGLSDIYIQKHDSLGILLWERIIGSSKADVRPSLSATPDSGFIINFFTVGNDSDITCYHIDSTNSWINQSVQAFKLDKNGNKKFLGCYGDEHHSARFERLLPCRDKGYLVWGRFGGPCSTISNAYRYSILKLDSAFQEQWRYCIETFLQNNYSVTALQNNEGDFYIVMDCDSIFYGNISQSNTSTGVLKLDSLGTFQWAKNLGGFQNNSIPTTSGGVCIVGRSSCSPNSGASDVYVNMLDKNGVLQHQTCIGGLNSDAGYDIVKNNNGGYYVGGWSASSIILEDTTNFHSSGTASNYSDAFIAELDSNFNYLSCQNYGGSSYDGIVNLTLHQNGSIWALGTTNSNDGDVSFNHGNRDVWLIQFVPDTILGIKESFDDFKNFIKIFPNPASNLFQVDLTKKFNKNIRLKLVDLMGKELLNVNLVESKTSINTAHLSNGLYFYKIIDSEGVLLTGKIVVEK